MQLQSPNPPDKPVLDLETFQQLLAAAYTLQESSCRLVLKEAKLDSPPIPLGTLEAEATKRQASKATQRKLARALRKVATGSRGKMPGRPVTQSNELFWTVSTLVAITALLLFGSLVRLSPLPAELALPSEMAQQPLPFQNSKGMATAQTSGVGQRPVATDPQRKANPGPNEQNGLAEQPPGIKGVNPASAGRTIVSPNPVRSAYESEADVVAENTVVRYGTRPATPRVHAQKP